MVAQSTNMAKQYPNSADALPGMQGPDSPGGPEANAPWKPSAMVDTKPNGTPYVPPPVVPLW